MNAPLWLAITIHMHPRLYEDQVLAPAIRLPRPRDSPGTEHYGREDRVARRYKSESYDAARNEICMNMLGYPFCSFCDR
jgi:hypothetical protein